MVHIIEELVDVIYIAGIVDGEGYFGIQKRKIKNGFKYEPYFGIRMTDIAPIELIRKYFGGNIRLVNMKDKKYKQQYDLRLSWHPAECFVKNILPYLKVKNFQAKLITNFFENITHLQCKKTKHKEIVRREKLYQEMRNLNSGKNNKGE